MVGAFPFARYDTAALALKPDDLLVCYTDGITEPENAYGETFGEERLMSWSRGMRIGTIGEILRIVLEAVRPGPAPPNCTTT